MDNKKAVAAAVAAAISAAGAVVDASFDDPAEILQNATPEPVVEYVDLADDSDAADAAQDEDKSKKPAQTKPASISERILQLPLAVRVLVVLPLWIVGHLVNLAGGLLFTALSPFMNWILSFALLALVITVAFTLAVKAIFPDLPISKILNRHTFKWILAATGCAFAADIALGIFWPGYAQFKNLITAGLTLAALGSLVLWFTRREKRRREKEAEKAAVPAAPEPPQVPDELVYTSLGQTFKIKNPEKSQQL